MAARSKLGGGHGGTVVRVVGVRSALAKSRCGGGMNGFPELLQSENARGRRRKRGGTSFPRRAWLRRAVAEGMPTKSQRFTSTTYAARRCNG
jgi:hypothetical protein